MRDANKPDRVIESIPGISRPTFFRHSASPELSPRDLTGDGRISSKSSTTSTRLRSFLQALNTTVYQISQATMHPPFGKETRAHIRDAFCAEIESGLTPNIYQVAALAKLTGYRFVDWLALFDYPVTEILRLQLKLHAEHTLVLPGTIYDPLVTVPRIRQLDSRIDLK